MGVDKMIHWTFDWENNRADGVDNASHFFPSLKLECEKLASEKMEIQRHYVMVSSLTK